MSTLSAKIVEIKEKYAAKHEIAEEAAERRQKKLEKLIPGLKEIDVRLAATGPRLLAVAMKKSNESFEDVKNSVIALRSERDMLLQANGYPADYTDPKYECTLCNDSGYVDERMCECLKKEIRAASYAHAGISKLIDKCTFDNFDLSYYEGNTQSYESMKRNFALIRQYAEIFNPNDSPNLILFGNTGLGKTHLSIATAKVVIDSGWDVIYTGATGMISDFESVRFHNDDDAIASGNSTQRYFDCQLLIIDDLGTEVINQFTTSCIYEIINRRINNGLSTIISCNLNQKELGSRYTDRIASRIFGEYMPLIFTGIDVRQQKISRGLV